MAELAPDLVITQDLCEVCAVSSGDLATACPIGTEVFSMNPRSLDDVVESVITLADRLGVHERGVAVAQAMRDKVEAVRRGGGGLGRPRVFIAEWMDPPYGSGHWLPEMVEAAGGTNVLSKPGEYSFATTWETVLGEEPELIVLAACGFSLESGARAHDRSASAGAHGRRGWRRALLAAGAPDRGRCPPARAPDPPEAVADPGPSVRRAAARRRARRLVDGLQRRESAASTLPEPGTYPRPV